MIDGLKKYAFLLIVSVFGCLGVMGQFSFPSNPFEATVEEQTPSISSAIHSSVESYSDQSFFIVGEYGMPSGWHAYYINPGMVGLPVEAGMEPIDGFKIEGPYFSVPEVFSGELGVSYGYAKFKSVFKVTPLSNAPEKAEFKVGASVQMCRDGECLPPEKLTQVISLKKGEGTVTGNLPDLLKGVSGIAWKSDKLIDSVIVTTEGAAIHMKLLAVSEGALDGKKVYFFSSDGEVFPPTPQTLTKLPNANEYLLRMERNVNRDSMYPNNNIKEGMPISPLRELKGVLSVDGEGVLVHEAITIESNVGFWELMIVLGGMFIGGLILNIMPCVFPVIGLKILGFVEMGGGEKKKVILHSLAFVVGVMLSFWALTILMISLKATLVARGQEISWAIWMQEPWVILSIMLLMIVLGMSMFGVFEIGVKATSVGAGLQQKKGWSGSFWSGVLATVVATPCSAPFLGTAITSALAFPAWGMFLAFTAMGAGMSLPYLLFSLFPGMLKYLPKPGAWMESFKQGVSFIFFAVAACLLYVYISALESLGGFDMMEMLVGLVIFSSAWWVYGRWCPIYRKKAVRMTGFAVALGLCVLGGYLSAPLKQVVDEPIVWQEWSVEVQQKALDEGKPVYVDFTAKWCATCISNKKIAYGLPVRRILNEHGVVLLRADKTTDKPEIDTAMRQLGRSSIPVNVLYVPGDSEPHITSEILTTGYLADFLEEKLEK